jgi:hypothetical protein
MQQPVNSGRIEWAKRRKLIKHTVCKNPLDW